jgi:hypothetical protein
MFCVLLCAVLASPKQKGKDAPPWCGWDDGTDVPAFCSSLSGVARHKLGVSPNWRLPDESFLKSYWSWAVLLLHSTVSQCGPPKVAGATVTRSLEAGYNRHESMAISLLASIATCPENLQIG